MYLILSTGALQGTGSGLDTRPGQRETVIQSSDATPSSMISLLASVSTILQGNPSLIKGLHSHQGDSAALAALVQHGEIQPPQLDWFPCLVFNSSSRDGVKWAWVTLLMRSSPELLNQGVLKHMVSLVGDKHAHVSLPGPCSLAGYSAPDTSGPKSDPTKMLY